MIWGRYGNKWASLCPLRRQSKTGNKETIFLLLFLLPSQVAVTEVKLTLRGPHLSAGGAPPGRPAEEATAEATQTVARVDAVHSFL